MSNTKFDSDGFQIVSSKRSPKSRPSKTPSNDLKLDKEDFLIDCKKSIRRIQSAVDDLRSSKYLEDASVSVSSILQSKKVSEIVCFGLGHIGECNISRHQLAFLLCLKDICATKKVLVHDPVFHKKECDILKQFGLAIIEKNEEGSYITSDQDITLLYLPHCPKQLTNNFLWSNWAPKLKNCVIICNSFSSVIENHPSRLLAEACPFIQKIFPYTTEIVLENNFKYTDIFNDTSIHHFPEEKLANLQPEFWDKGEKPTYKNSEEFITALVIAKLNF